MPDYKSMYLQLFNRITDVVEILQKAQQAGEEEYVKSEDPTLIILHKEQPDERE